MHVGMYPWIFNIKDSALTELETRSGSSCFCLRLDTNLTLLAVESTIFLIHGALNNCVLWVTPWYGVWSMGCRCGRSMSAIEGSHSTWHRLCIIIWGVVSWSGCGVYVQLGSIKRCGSSRVNTVLPRAMFGEVAERWMGGRDGTCNWQVLNY